MQEDEDRTRHSIALWSLGLTSAENNYYTGVKESLAVIWAVQIIRRYLERSHCDLYIENQALRWVMSMTDESGRLARRRLRLLEYDFIVHYRNGLKNQIANAVSLLSTFSETTIASDKELLGYVIEGLNSHIGPASDCRHTDLDYEPEDEIDPLDGDTVLTTADERTEINSAVITREEILREQQSDGYCVKLRRKVIEDPTYPFAENDQGYLVRIAKIDKMEHIVLPKTLRERALYLAHYSALIGHPGRTRLYYNLRRQVYWPSMTMDVYSTVRNCIPCARERIILGRHSSFLRLFPETAPLEFVGIDILGPLRKTGSGHEYILVITDRFAKMAVIVPLKTVTVYTVAKAFCERWLFVYGPPRNVISDNGKQSASKFFLAVCGSLRVRNLFTFTYHSQ